MAKKKSDAPKSVFVPTLEYDSSYNNPWRASVAGESGEREFTTIAKKPGMIRKQLLLYADNRIEQWQEFKRLVDYCMKELQLPPKKER